ncbi:hypothetical protein L798_11081 [Zootermopsis nevadensis]|uniref:Uncharacterized protein n=1 Tax=Zootermopsis nevadensis TaxID=136037 RepID=A0A067R6Q1_ZOONE|nr:hypothetical protein L798_11081 [Zootermopsis nevadensis]
MEYRNGLPDLDVFKMAMNFLHKDTDLIMQQIVDEMENFRKDLKMKLNEMEIRTEEQEEFSAEAGSQPLKSTASM